ncbi:MAG: nucleoside-diphosphate kinase [Chloroflexota bacterium]|nr:nucleoside-diphosphate kinase [Chloroflexota bacterium]
MGNTERTLIIVKPDGVQRGLVGEIVARFERRGLKIVAMQMQQVSADTAQRHYGEHEGKPFFAGLVEYITSSPVVILVLEGPQAVAVARATIGSTKPAEAAPGTIRADFGLMVGRNLIHGSDSVESAEREIGIFFGDSPVFSYGRELDRWILE